MGRSAAGYGVCMGKDRPVTGAAFSEEEIEAWAADAESEQGYTGEHLGPSVVGPPRKDRPKRAD